MPAHPSIAANLCAEQERLLYASLPVSLAITIISASVLALMQAEILGRMPVLIWGLAILLVTAARAMLAAAYRRGAPKTARCVTWLQRFRIGALAAGMVWGAAGWLLFTPNDIAHQAFLSMVLAGVAAGAVSSLSVDRTTALGFVLSLLLPITVQLLGGDHPLQLAMGVMAVLLLLVLSVNAHRFNRNIVENLSLRLAAGPHEQALRESESRWQFALNGAGDGVWDWKIQTGEVFFSPRWKAMLGYANEDIGNTVTEWASRIHPEDKAAYDAELERHLCGETPAYSHEHRMRCKDGSYKWILDRGQVIEYAGGGPLRMIGTHADISERKAVETALAESKLRLQTIIEAEPECVKQLARDGTLLQMNRAGLDMIEADSAEQVIGHKVTGIITPACRKDFIALTKRVFAGGQGTLVFEIIGLKGSRRWLETHAVPLRDTHGHITALLSITRDITAHKAATEHIQHLAHHDALTDLPNRTLLHERLTHAIYLAQRKNESFAVLFLDLDRFKHVNDSLGHQVGDRLLVEVAHRLQACARASDTLARIGGDEFVLVLADVAGANTTAHVVQKVFAVLQQPFLLEGRELTITPSIGISLFPDDGSNADELIRNADAAMYQAKEAGRSTFHFYTADMNARAMDLLALEAALRRALERDELVLFYQPKIELASGRMIGVEALIRWQHPEWGLVPPARFIPLAEETGLILPIGDWALREACRQTVAWRAQGRTLTMAVNLAARQFRQPDLVARVAAILAETGLEAAALELEITESAMMHNPQQVTETLIELKRIGVQIAIDDFGTGYSSLGYLKHFPIDVLKIDQTFIRDAPTHPHDAAIVRVIIDMARALNLQVVAEGVETAAHLDFVQNLGCDLAQGYHFAKPMPADELIQLGNTTGRPGQPPAPLTQAMPEITVNQA